jgi:carbamoyl-phosphate synthase small subunit
MSAQFHPEAAPGPRDARWIFDDFVELVKSGTSPATGS